MNSHDKLRDQIHDVLHDAETAGRSVVSETDADSDADAAETELLEAAGEARALLESTEPTRLLEALGLETLPDGSEAESIPAAIARGEPDQLEMLGRLLSLAKLAERGDDDTLEIAVDDLRETIDHADGSADATGATAVGGNESDLRSEADEEVEIESDRAGADESRVEDEPSEEPAERLRSAMQSSVSDFGDEIRQLRERLEAARDEPADDGDSEDARSDEETDAGLSKPELGIDLDRDSGSGHGGRYSTMAPPPSKRADMRAVTRYSTLPRKNRD